MPQPDLIREGYAVFVRCGDLSAVTPIGEFVATIKTLDGILFDQIGKKADGFFPNPYGGAIFCNHVGEALSAACALVTGLAASGISAGIGVSWGRFHRTTNVHEWNAAALPLNVAARLAFCKAAAGRVLVSPHVRDKAGKRAEFGPEVTCIIKGGNYPYYAIESADYRQGVAGHLIPATPKIYERNIVLWDIVKYSTKDPDDQAALSHSLAISATTALHIFGAKKEAYSPAGDGGFAVFDSGMRAFEFAKWLGKDAKSRDITIRTGIYQGEVAFTRRGPVGPGVLRADAISAQAAPCGIAMLADVWRSLDKGARAEWRPTEIADNIFALEAVQTLPAPVTVPPLPANYLERSEAVASLRSALLAPGGGNVIALVALEGMGGIGKTVLAQTLFKDVTVQKAFPDGLLWVTVGREPTYDLGEKLREIVHGLGGPSDPNLSPESLYKTTLANKTALIVIDDIWNKAHLDPFLVKSHGSRILFTTRNPAIARLSGAREHRADLMDAGQSRELLALWAGLDVGELPPAAVDILRECDNLPGALAMIGGLLRGASPIEWADVAQLLHNADLSSIEEQLPPGQQSFFRATDLSVKALPPSVQQHYLGLAVLLDDMPASLPILQTLWCVNDAEARRIGRLLADRSLAQRDDDTGIRLHDLQVDYLRARYPNRETLELIRAAVQLSARVIEKDPQQFASQLIGRLLPYQNISAIDEFITTIADGAPSRWLRPLRPALRAPGQAPGPTAEGHYSGVQGLALSGDGRLLASASWDETLKLWDLDTGHVLRTLAGHSSAVYGVAMTADGKLAVSAAGDKTLKVWDLETGLEVRTLAGHTDGIGDVAITRDGRLAVSASDDTTLRVWEVKTGRELRVLAGHSSYVHHVAVSDDGRLAVSASEDTTLKIWDLETGRELRTLVGHGSAVWAVAVDRDWRVAVSASHDKTLKVWDLATGRELHTLYGHASPVYGVAVTADARRGVSASHDKTLKVWDLESGLELHTLRGHNSFVLNAVVSQDGRLVVSGCDDATLKVWNLESGLEIRTLAGQHSFIDAVAVCLSRNLAVLASGDGTLQLWSIERRSLLGKLIGHTSFVYDVAVSSDARLAVSASGDGTLKVWDLETNLEVGTLAGHSSAVTGVGLSKDGKLAVSSSDDATLKVWNLETGLEQRTIAAHAGGVWEVGLSADGRIAVSASDDTTLKVWDLETGRELHKLTGHLAAVTGVAVSSDGRMAVSASDDSTLKIWDLETGRELGTLLGHSDSVYNVSLNYECTRAISASDDHTLKVWDLKTQAAIATFSCDSAASCCAFVSDHELVAGDFMGKVHFLSLVVNSELTERLIASAF